MRDGLVMTRHRKYEKTRKMTRYILLARSSGVELIGVPGVILLTFTA